MSNTLTPQGLESCLAFGAASLAVMEAAEELERAGAHEGPAAASYRELATSHDRLRRLFADGATDGLPELALSVMVLAERTVSLLA